MASQTSVPCVKCGFPLSIGLSFCTKCGASQASALMIQWELLPPRFDVTCFSWNYDLVKLYADRPVAPGEICRESVKLPDKGLYKEIWKEGRGWIRTAQGGAYLGLFEGRFEAASSQALSFRYSAIRDRGRRKVAARVAFGYHQRYMDTPFYWLEVVRPQEMHVGIGFQFVDEQAEELFVKLLETHEREARSWYELVSSSLFTACKAKGRLSINDAFSMFERLGIFGEYFTTYSIDPRDWVKKKIVPVIMGWIRDGRLDGIYDEEGEQYLSKTMLEAERSKGVQIGVLSVAGDLLQQGAAKVDIKDSVVQRTQFGAGAIKPRYCPHCGQPIDMPGTPKFCPECGGKLA